jgi:hypothetical protein
MIPRYWSLAGIFRVLLLYLVLVLYSAGYEVFYATELTQLYHDDYTAFDLGKLRVYELLCFLTPLAVLPLGTRLRAPAQLIVGAAVVFLFIPIPVVFVPMVSEAEFWQVYALLWLGYFAVCSLAPLAVNIRLPEVTDVGYRRAVFIFFLLAALGFAYTIETNNFQIVSLDKAHAAQKDVTISGWQGYLLVGYLGSFGGLLIAFAIMFRKYYLLPLALLGYYCCYGSLSERNALFMPCWIAYVYFAQRWFFRDSVIRYVLTVMAPFLFFFFLSLALGLEDRGSTFYDVFTLANYRLYSVPAISFNVYYHFFALNPFTYWSHIGFISNFVHYPYAQPLAAVMAETYSLGNDNASFLETDGLAAAGPVTLPFISVIFGLVMMVINSCLRGLNITLCAIVMGGLSVTLMETGIGPGLLTNGLALMSVILLFAPRNAAWNRRYLNPSRSAAAGVRLTA